MYRNSRGCGASEVWRLNDFLARWTPISCRFSGMGMLLLRMNTLMVERYLKGSAVKDSDVEC